MNISHFVTSECKSWQQRTFNSSREYAFKLQYHQLSATIKQCHHHHIHVHGKRKKKKCILTSFAKAAVDVRPRRAHTRLAPLLCQPARLVGSSVGAPENNKRGCWCCGVVSTAPSFSTKALRHQSKRVHKSTSLHPDNKLNCLRLNNLRFSILL